MEDDEYPFQQEVDMPLLLHDLDYQAGILERDNIIRRLNS